MLLGDEICPLEKVSFVLWDIWCFEAVSSRMNPLYRLSELSSDQLIFWHVDDRWNPFPNRWFVNIIMTLSNISATNWERITSPKWPSASDALRSCHYSKVRSKTLKKFTAKLLFIWFNNVFKRLESDMEMSSKKPVGSRKRPWTQRSCTTIFIIFFLFVDYFSRGCRWPWLKKVEYIDMSFMRFDELLFFMKKIAPAPLQKWKTSQRCLSIQSFVPFCSIFILY